MEEHKARYAATVLRLIEGLVPYDRVVDDGARSTVPHATLARDGA
jgi:hypothetical protein